MVHRRLITWIFYHSPSGGAIQGTAHCIFPLQPLPHSDPWVMTMSGGLHLARSIGRLKKAGAELLGLLIRVSGPRRICRKYLYY
jgi:hypothetical protein